MNGSPIFPDLQNRGRGRTRSLRSHPGVFALLILAAPTLFCSCEPSDNFSGFQEVEDSRSEIPPPEFTAGERERIDEIRRAGGLRVATSLWEGIFMEGADGGYRGFHYELAQEVGLQLNLPVEYEIVAFKDFFTVNGEIPLEVKTDPNVSYSPEIFETADIVAYDISILPWREKLMDFIPVLPVRMLVLAPKSAPIVQLGDLWGKRGIVFRDTSHETYLNQLNDRFGLGIDILPVAHGTDLHEAVLSGEADFCIRDAAGALPALKGSPEMTVTMALGNPLENSWAVAEGDDHLRSAVEKVIRYARETGRLDRFFMKAYGTDIAGYFDLIDYRPGNRLLLDAEETAYLDRVRSEGGFIAAIDEEQSIYERVGEGAPAGLHYNLALAMADLLEMPLALEPVNFREFFMRDGSVDDRLMTDPDFSYTPDLLDRVDFYIATMSPVAWRRKFLRFIPIYPTKLTYMIRKGTPIPDPENLDGWTFTILRDTSYEIWMREHLDMERIEMVYSETGLDQARLVSEGLADATISDANLALTRFYAYPNLTIYPADDNIDNLSWAVAADNAVLAGIIEKAVAYLKADSTFEKTWQAYYGTTFDEYLKLLSLDDVTNP